MAAMLCSNDRMCASEFLQRSKYSYPMACAERRSVRARKVSQRIGKVSAADREDAVSARLEALENDDAAGEGVVGDSDEEFLLDESDEGG